MLDSVDFFLTNDFDECSYNSDEFNKFDFILEHIDERLYRTGQADILLYWFYIHENKSITFIKDDSFEVTEFFYDSLHDFKLYNSILKPLDLNLYNQIIFDLKNLNFFFFLYYCFLLFFRKFFYYFCEGNSLIIFNILSISNFFYSLFFIHFSKILSFISLCFQSFFFKNFSKNFLSFSSFLFFEFQYSRINFYIFTYIFFKKYIKIIPFFFTLNFWIPILSFFKFIHNITYICRMIYNDYINSCVFITSLRKSLIKTFYTRPSKFRKTVGVYFSSTRIRESFYIDLFFSFYIFYYSTSFLHKFPFNYFLKNNKFLISKYKCVDTYSFIDNNLLKFFISNFYSSLFLNFDFFDLFFLEHFSFNLFFINSFLFFLKHPRVFILKKIRFFKYQDLFLFFSSNFLFSLNFLFFFNKLLKKQFFNFIFNFNFFYKFDLFFYLENMRKIKLYDFFSYIAFNFSLFFFNNLIIKKDIFSLRDFSRLKSYRFRYRTLIKNRLKKRINFVKNLFTFSFFNFFFNFFDFFDNLNFYIFWNITCFPIINSFSFLNVGLMHYFSFSFSNYFFKNSELHRFVDEVFTLNSFVFFFNKFSFFINNLQSCKLLFIFFFDFCLFYRFFKYLFYGFHKKSLLNNNLLFDVFFFYKKSYEDIYH